MSATFQGTKADPTQVTLDEGEVKVAINGFQQVIEMLQTCDPAFRDSLLKRIAIRDKKLALAIKKDLDESIY